MWRMFFIDIFMSFCSSNSCELEVLKLFFLMSTTDFKYFVKEWNPTVKTHFLVIFGDSIIFDEFHLNFDLFSFKFISK